MGLAILPDSNIQSWRSPLGTYYHPCRNKQHLSRAVVSVYTIQTDRITVLRSQREAQEFFFDSIVNASMPVSAPVGGIYGFYGANPIPAANTIGSSMTAVVFQGTQFPVMTDPFVIRSTNPLLGVGRVPRLTLMVRLSKGKAISMRWDIRDGACGACRLGNCISNQVCAVPEEDCQCAIGCQGTGLCGNCPTHIDQCSFAVYVAFLGEDKHKEPMKTGVELERLREYSMSAGLTDRVNSVSAHRDSLQQKFGNIQG